MEEKQEFQLGDIFYLIFKNYKKEWKLRKEKITGIEKEEEGIYIKSEHTKVLQRFCGHSLKEAKDIATKNFYLECKGQVQKIRDLKE